MRGGSRSVRAARFVDLDRGSVKASAPLSLSFPLSANRSNLGVHYSTGGRRKGQNPSRSICCSAAPECMTRRKRPSSRARRSSSLVAGLRGQDRICLEGSEVHWRGSRESGGRKRLIEREGFVCSACRLPQGSGRAHRGPSAAAAVADLICGP